MRASIALDKDFHRPLEPGDQSNTSPARRTWRDVVVAISVEIISLIEQILEVRLETPLFSDGEEHGCVRTRVSR